MLIGQLKNWGILSQIFYCHITMHGNVFWACAVVTQLTIEVKVEMSSEPLFVFEVGYEITLK